MLLAFSKFKKIDEEIPFGEKTDLLSKTEFSIEVKNKIEINYNVPFEIKPKIVNEEQKHEHVKKKFLRNNQLLWLV